MAFGKLFCLDCYNCEADLNSIELVYRFLEELVELIGMTPMGNPAVIHGPRKNGVELYPDKEGVSGVQFLIESSITVHTIIPKKFVTLDIYTCGELDWATQSKVIKFAKDTFKFFDSEIN